MKDKKHIGIFVALVVAIFLFITFISNGHSASATITVYADKDSGPVKLLTGFLHGVTYAIDNFQDGEAYIAVIKPLPTACGNEICEKGPWKIVWSDEFNGSVVDTSKWHVWDWAYHYVRVYLPTTTPTSVVQQGITIDVSKSLGKMPELFKAGMWFGKLDDDVYIKDKFFSENAVGAIQIIQPLSDNLRESKSFEDYKQKLNESLAIGTINRKRIEDIKKTGEILMIGHWPAAMPAWLSSSADTRLYTNSGWWNVSQNSPPKCYDYECIIDRKKIAGWANVIDYTLRFFKDELGIKNLGYYLGHEQNKDWIGKEEDFYKLYKYTAKAAKSVSPNILVGGVGPWSLGAKRLECSPVDYNGVGLEYCNSIAGWSIDNWIDPMNQNFIEYAKQNNLPIDFINWHSFATRPNEFSEQTIEMKSWLEANGYSAEKVKFYPADWAYWSAGFADSRGPYYYPFDQIDTEENSSYVLSSLYFMNKAGIQWHSHDFDVDYPKIEAVVFDARKSEFIGDWPIFTRSQIIKPVYNAFRALSILNGKQEGKTSNRLSVSMPEDDFVAAIASQTKDKKTNRVLLSNFIPSGIMTRSLLLQTLKSCMLTKYSEDEYNRIFDALKQTAKANPPKKGSTPEYIKQIIQKTDFSDPLNDQKVRQDLNSCLSTVVEKAKEIQNYQKNPKEVKLTLSNLKPGTYTLNTYTIDKDHSNSCRYNKKTEPTPTDTECGINGEIDRRVKAAKEEAQEKSKQAAYSYLKSKGYTDRDIGLIVEMVKRCEMKVQCMIETVDQHYLKLDRCKNNKCSSSEIVKSEIKEAIKIFQDTKDKIFYEAIDKINNLPQVSLEGSKQTKTITINRNGSYQGIITMQPYSVVLVEVIKR